MTREAIQGRWEFDLRSSPEALWPYVADTNTFNRDVGLPVVAGEPGGDADQAARQNSRRRLRLKLGPLVVRWVEEPFEWVRPRLFTVVRRYESGPVSEARVRVELFPREGGGTRLVYGLEAVPRNPLARAAVPLQMRLMRRRFGRAFRAYDRAALTRGPAPDPAPPVRLSARSQLTDGGRARLRQGIERVVSGGADPTLAARLSELIERGDRLALARLRPYALADLWGAPRRQVLELCLHATRAGLLDFRWELLCPLCRGAEHAPSSLRDVTSGQHCGSCRIDFSVNFDRSVEVTFRPNPSVRKAERTDYCVGGPATTPHVSVQQLLGPGESRTVRPLLDAGRYRLRTLTLPGAQPLRVEEAGEAELAVAVGGAWPGGELTVGPAPSLRLENPTRDEQLFILERTAWSDQAATAAEVTALQLFRDLFAEEALRPGEQISVGSLTLLFTDLRGSTQLYRQIGDAPAFGAVMSHFDVLRAAIAGEGGAIVKTLGDAVMGAFTRPAPALRAVMRAQAVLASPPAGLRPLALKAGIHAGPCIAVTLNGRLDYFGSNVNIAARLEPLSTGADCVISRAVRDDPKVAAMLADSGSGLAVEPLQTTLKGFDSESFDLWRVTRKEAPPREAGIKSLETTA